MVMLFVFATAVSTIIIKTFVSQESYVLAVDENNASMSSQTERTNRVSINSPPHRPVTETPHLSGTPAIERRIMKDVEKTNPATPAGALKGKLSEIKRQRCESKSKGILDRSTKLNTLIDNAQQKFTLIVDGIKEYVIKQNVSLPNYETLIASINMKKEAVPPLVEVVKSDVAGFSCAGDNPAEQLKKHREDAQAVVEALHAYRVSIKNLIQAIQDSSSRPTP